MDEVNGTKRLKFSVVIEVDPVTHNCGYSMNGDDAFPHAVIVNTLEKVKQRVINDQLMFEAKQMTMAEAQKIQVAKSVPKRF